MGKPPFISIPCLNDGLCINSENAWFCNCQPGYEGFKCQYDVQECRNAPCENGGSCEDLVNDYNCECIDGYIGKSCEIDVNECESQPCQFGSSCLNGLQGGFSKMSHKGPKMDKNG